jgi:hypothetical protein
MAIASVLQPVRSMDSEHCRWHIPPPNFHQPHRPRFLRACLVPLPFHSTFPPSPPSSWQYAPPAALRSQTVVSVDEGKVKRQLIVCSTGFTPNVEFSRTFPLPPILGSCFLLISIYVQYIYKILPATSPRAPLLTPSCGLHPKPIVALLLPPCGPQFLGISWQNETPAMAGTRHEWIQDIPKQGFSLGCKHQTEGTSASSMV